MPRDLEAGLGGRDRSRDVVVSTVTRRSRTVQRKWSAKRLMWWSARRRAWRHRHEYTRRSRKAPRYAGTDQRDDTFDFDVAGGLAAHLVGCLLGSVLTWSEAPPSHPDVPRLR